MDPLCVDAVDEEVGRITAGDAGVGEVRRGKDERTLADEVAPVAEDGGPLGRVVGDALVVLLVLGVAEEDGALDLLLDGGAELREGSGDDGGTLAEDVLVCNSTYSSWGWILMLAYLYPPVTTEAWGHFWLAMLKRRTASSMAAWLVPLGRRLSAVEAS